MSNDHSFDKILSIANFDTDFQRVLGTDYVAVVTLPFGSLGTAIEWCRDNAKDQFLVQQHSGEPINNSSTHSFFFVNEKDYLLFVLKWANYKEKL